MLEPLLVQHQARELDPVGVSAGRGEVMEETIGVRHLGDAARVNEGADLHDVDAGAQHGLDR